MELFLSFNCSITSTTEGGRRLRFHPFVCLAVCEQDISKSQGRIWTKLEGQVGFVTRINWFDFGEHLDQDMRILKVILHNWDIKPKTTFQNVMNSWSCSILSIGPAVASPLLFMLFLLGSRSSLSLHSVHKKIKGPPQFWGRRQVGEFSLKAEQIINSGSPSALHKGRLHTCSCFKQYCWLLLFSNNNKKSYFTILQP